MTHRSFAGLGIALIVLGGSTALLVAYLRAQSPEAKFDRISKGMSKAEVEAVLGRPADQSYTTVWAGFSEGPPRPSESNDWQEVTAGYWRVGDHGIEVWFDERGITYSKDLFELAAGPTLFQRVAAWLGL